MYQSLDNENRVRSLITVDPDSPEEFFAWWGDMVNAVGSRQQMLQEHDTIRRNFYEGIQTFDSVFTRGGNSTIIDFFRKMKVTVNKTQEIIDNWVAKMTRYTPAVDITPANSQEFSDHSAARLSKAFLDSLWYKYDAVDVLAQLARDSRIDGDGCLFVLWDKNKGDISNDQQRANRLAIEQGRQLLIDSSGQVVTGCGGHNLYVTPSRRVGDVDWINVPRHRVIFEPLVECKTKLNWVVRYEMVDVDILISEYPDLAYQISSNGDKSTESLIVNNYKATPEQCYVYYLYHKGTSFLDAGAYYKWTGDVILEQSTLVEEVGHRGLPVVFLSDWRLPNQIYSKSIVDKLMQLQIMLNNLYSIIYTNIALGSHIYWMLPRSARVQRDHIRNKAGILEYSGNIPPQLAQFRTLDPGLLNFIAIVEQAMDKLTATHGISRGELPTGVEHGIAMSFLEEQEMQMAHPDIQKQDKAIEQFAKLNLAVCGSKYKPEDGRTLRILGKNDSFSIKKLGEIKLDGTYDIRVNRSSATGQSKAGRIAELTSVERLVPGSVPKEILRGALDIGDKDRITDLVTGAKIAAERENELFIDGVLVADPEQHEDHLTHWYVIAQFCQTVSFKHDLALDIQERAKDHGSAHEMFIAQKMINPVYRQKILVEYPEFPKFTPVEIIQQIMLGTPIQEVLAPPQPQQEAQIQEKEQINEEVKNEAA